MHHTIPQGTSDNSENDSRIQHIDTSQLLHLVSQGGRQARKKLIALIEVLPHEQENISLGIFNTAHRPLGYIVECEPEDVNGDEISMQVHQLPAGQSSMYELRLFIANYGTEAITAKILELLEKP